MTTTPPDDGRHERLMDRVGDLVKKAERVVDVEVRPKEREQVEKPQLSDELCEALSGYRTRRAQAQQQQNSRHRPSAGNANGANLLREDNLQSQSYSSQYEKIQMTLSTQLNNDDDIPTDSLREPDTSTAALTVVRKVSNDFQNDFGCTDEDEPKKSGGHILALQSMFDIQTPRVCYLEN